MDRVSKILSDLIPAGVGWGCWRAEKVAPQEKFPCVLSDLGVGVGIVGVQEKFSRVLGALVYTYKKVGGALYLQRYSL